MQTLRVVRKEVNYSPVLLHIGLWTWLESMDHVREFHPISDKEHRHIVPNKVKVTLSGVEFHRKTTWIPQGLRASTLMHDGREPDNNWGLNPRSPEKISTGKVRNIMSHLKEPLCAGSPCMNNTFRDTFPVELRKLFNQMIILKEDRSFDFESL